MISALVFPAVHVPAFQPIPFPLPVWLLEVLIVAGFFLHVIPMNLAWAGGFLSGFCLMKKNHPHAARLGHGMACSLPIVISFAITQGIVPLLFLQLMYGPLYYSSSIVMAIPWLSVLFILGAGYYLFYVYKYQFQKLGAWGPWLLILASALFTVIGFFFSNNMTLMLAPDRWNDLMAQNNEGWILNLGEPQLWPRYLHMLLAAFAISGLGIGCLGLYWQNKQQNQNDLDYGNWLVKTGSGLYLMITLVQMGVGFWFMMALPREHMRAYMGQDPVATGVFGLGMLLSIVSIVGAMLAWKDGKGKWFVTALLSGLLVVLDMAVMRHLLREMTIQSFFDASAAPVSIQWDLFIAFLILTVGLIAYLVWLVRISWHAYHHPDPTAPGAMMVEEFHPEA